MIIQYPNRFVETHPRLHSLSLLWVYQFGIKFLETLASLCSPSNNNDNNNDNNNNNNNNTNTNTGQLSYIRFFNCNQINDDMVAIMGKLSMVKSFHLEGSQLVTDIGLKQALQHLTNNLQEVIHAICQYINRST